MVNLDRSCSADQSEFLLRKMASNNLSLNYSNVKTIKIDFHFVDLYLIVLRALTPLKTSVWALSKYAESKTL